MSDTLQDEIVNSSHHLYSNLPTHGKPVTRSNGIKEWTILATISIFLPSSQSQDRRVIPISLGTGVKCLPYSKLSKFGDTLHDSHAEIIARRGFLRWLLWQAILYTRKQIGEIVQDEIFLDFDNGKFTLKDGIEVWLYISMLPCGDASTLYTSSHQPTEQASQWSEVDSSIPSPSEASYNNDTNSMGVVRGRNGYTTISTLRTKPGRPDSIPSISMSCSDKIATWSVLGIQGGLLSNIFQKPIYLDGIIVGGIETPKSMIEDEWKEKIKREVGRSIWGRLEGIRDYLLSPYTLHRPSIHLTSIPFEHSKASIISTLPPNSLEPAPSPLSLSHLSFLPSSSHKKGNKPEIIADGGILGFPRKQGILLRDKGRSRICKLSLLEQYEKLLALSENQEGAIRPDGNTKNDQTYFEYKHPHQSGYQLAKSVLRGIPKKGEIAIKGLERFNDLSTTDTVGDPAAEEIKSKNPLPPPFRGWLVSGKEFESFTCSVLISTTEGIH